jgi:serine/threonine protein kinase
MTERDIFIAALQMKDPAQRQAYLDEACAGQPELCQQVKHLLRLHEGAGSFLDKPAAESAATGAFPDAAERASSEAPGALIGSYKLLEQIGEGGMGTVWMAQQTEPVRRLVALKVIKPGMDSLQVIARFEAERQALALMEHPNIARVLDAGTTASGRPYFVMELVKGVPLTKYCDENRLTPKQRLELFVPVCQAVQHAHQKGIIHRDIKPSNVLVALYDGRPVPKVIDFGIAKATGQQLTEKTLVTGFGAIVGTLEYMSPEQAELNQLDIDTRSDVYSLGVLLYELLTGSTPLEKKRLKQAAMLEVLRLIREEEPPRPSTRLSTTDELPSVAANRGLEPKKLSGLVRGELDWIVMKALEKDRNRRYETANGFAMDVQRYLADEPVLACPPSAGYRLRKFVRRNRLQVIAVSVVLLALVAGVIGTTLGLVQAKRSAEAERKAKLDADAKRLAAEAAEAKEAEQRKKAEAETALANAVKAFLQYDVLELADPATQQQQGVALKYDADVRLRDVVLRAAEKIEGKFQDRPLVEAEIRYTLGYTLLGMGRPDPAAKQFERVRELRREHLGLDHLDTLASMNSLANSYAALGRHADALKLHEETLAQQKAKLSPDHPDTLMTMHNLANSYAALGRQADALELREETLALRKAKLGPDHPDTLRSMFNLAASYLLLDRHAEALKVLEETLALQKAKLGPDHPDTLRSMGGLATAYAALGRHADALKLYEETLALRKAKLGPDHPATLQTMLNLANSYAALGRQADALKLYEETLALRKAKLGLDHLGTLQTMHNLAIAYAALGQHAEALKLREETLALQKRKLGPDHPETLNSEWGVIDSLMELKRPAEALPRIDALVAMADKSVAAGKRPHPRLVPAMFHIRMRIPWEAKDAAGCRATAERWEKRNPKTAIELYDAARYWAVTAAVQAQTPGADATRLAQEDAEKAMDWLRRAVAAGCKDRAQMEKDSDLDFLRGREDFKKLLAELRKDEM